MAIAGSPNNPRSLWIEQPPQVFTPAFTFKHPQSNEHMFSKHGARTMGWSQIKRDFFLKKKKKKNLVQGIFIILSCMKLLLYPFF
jgi:hypothetical protein